MMNQTLLDAALAEGLDVTNPADWAALSLLAATLEAA